MERSGWFCLWRELFEKPIWANSTNDQRSVFMTILYLASWKEREWDICGEKFTIHPGEVFISVRRLAEEAHVTVDVARNALKRFTELGFISPNQRQNRGTLITVVNWGKYQDRDWENPEPKTEPIPNQSRTNPEPLKEQCNQVTSNISHTNRAGARVCAYIEQPNANSTVTTVEGAESQKISNTNLTGGTVEKVESGVESEKLRTDFTRPSVEEVESYIREMGYHFNARAFVAYYRARGWKTGNGVDLQDWREACIGWERREMNGDGKCQRGFSQNLHKPARNGRSTGRGQSPDAWRGITADNYWKS